MLFAILPLLMLIGLRGSLGFGHFRRPSCLLQPRFTFEIAALFDNSIDLTPERNSKVVKRLVRKGDVSKGHPLVGDTAYIGWKIYAQNGTLVHSTVPPSLAWLSDLMTEEDEEEQEPPFSFILGAEPRDVIRGWELGIRSMYEGEIAVFDIHSDYAFASTGVETLGIAPNTSITTEVELLRIIPSPMRTYKTVGFNESIKEELMEKIQRGESPISREALQRQTGQNPNTPSKPAAPFWGSSVTGNSDLPEGYVEEVSFIDVAANPAPAQKYQSSATIPSKLSSSNGTKVNLSNVTGVNASDSDPDGSKEKAATNPNQYITGEGRGHWWAEDVRIIDVYMPLPGVVQKSQVSVKVEKKSLHVSLETDDGPVVLLSGPLHGNVLPSSTSWALMPPDPAAAHKGERLLVSLEKSYGSTGIWASVLETSYIIGSKTKGDGEKSSEGGV